MNKLSLIIPAKNEEKRLARTLSSYGAYFESKLADFETEILVVVNNSVDLTSQVVDEYRAKYPFIRKLETHYASGKGGAVSYGFKNATGNFIGFVDADGSVVPSEVHRLYEFLNETPWLDGVIGSRTGEKVQRTFWRKILGKLFNFYVKSFFAFPYKDTQCGVKIFRSIVARNIAKKLSNTGWVFDVNVLLVAKYLNYRLIELPIKWSEKEGSKFSFFEALINVPKELYALKLLETTHNINVFLHRYFGTSTRRKYVTPIKNILIFAWRDLKHPECGGSEVYTHQIAKRLAKKYHVTLFTSQPGNLSGKDLIDDVHIVRKGSFVTVYIWAFLYYIFSLRKKADFIIDVENGIPFFTPLFSRKPKLMLLHHVHKSQWFKQFPLPIALVGFILESVVMPFVYRKVPVVTVSPSSMSELKSIGFNDKMIYLGYNSIPPRLGGKYDKSPTPLLTYIGRVKAYKRLELGIKILPRLLKEYPNLKLLIGGTGDYEDKLKALVSKLNLGESVEFLGYVSEKKKWEVMQKAWVFLMPSMKEGWGITIIEAASCGTPSVGFNVCGVRDSILDGNTGILADSDQKYYEAVRELLKRDSVRLTMGEKCVQWAHKFSWNSTTKIFTNIIDSFYTPKDLLSDKIYPWELDLRAESITSLANLD